jgi:hypothetical protein
VHWLALGLLTLSLATAMFALFPRLPRGRGGVVFWQDILAHESAEKYVAALVTHGLSSIEQEYAQQNYFVSKVVHRKMRWVQWAMALLLFGAASLVVCMLK